MSNVFSNKKVLIVDDEEEIVEIIKEYFEEEFACQIESTVNGYEALKLLEKNKYDLVCSDLHMPVMDGANLLKALREGDTDNKNINFLIVSAYPTDSDRLISQYDDVLILDKPINEKRLISNAKLFLRLS